MKKQDYLFILRKVAQKGFAEALQYVKESENVHYNEVLRYLIDKKIVKSRSSVTLVLNGLTELGLLIRTVSDARPIRTTYHVSKKGHRVIKGLRAFEKEASD